MASSRTRSGALLFRPPENLVPKHRTALRNRLEAFLAGALGAAVARKTPEAAESTGRALGRLYHRLDARRRNLARTNLARAFPEMSPEEVDALSVRVFEHFGGVAAELLYALSHDLADALTRVDTEAVSYTHLTLPPNRAVTISV